MALSPFLTVSSPNHRHHCANPAVGRRATFNGHLTGQLDREASVFKRSTYIHTYIHSQSSGRSCPSGRRLGPRPSRPNNGAGHLSTATMLSAICPWCSWLRAPCGVGADGKPEGNSPNAQPVSSAVRCGAARCAEPGLKDDAVKTQLVGRWPAKAWQSKGPRQGDHVRLRVDRWSKHGFGRGDAAPHG